MPRKLAGDPPLAPSTTPVRQWRVFEQALGIGSPWYVERTEFDAEARRLDIHLAFERGGTFECGALGCTRCWTRRGSGWTRRGHTS